MPTLTEKLVSEMAPGFYMRGSLFYEFSKGDQEHMIKCAVSKGVLTVACRITGPTPSCHTYGYMHKRKCKCPLIPGRGDIIYVKN